MKVISIRVDAPSSGQSKFDVTMT